ncbi:MAG: hypothetical protein ACJ8CN_11790 [Gemmatimonadales bacterium]
MTPQIFKEADALSVFNLPPIPNVPVGQVHPPLQSVTRFKALRIYCCNPEGGGNPRADRLRMDLFGDELHAGSVYTEREIMIIGEECERTLEWLIGEQGLNETGAERGRANTLWYHLKWMRRERDRLIASRIARSLADGEKGDKSVKVSFGFVLTSPYWTDDYGWFLQRTRNLLDLVNAGRYYIELSTLSIWFETEADAVAYRNRVAMSGT